MPNDLKHPESAQSVESDPLISKGLSEPIPRAGNNSDRPLVESALFTFRVDKKLKEAFQVACKETDKSASQLIRGAMREYVERINA